MQTGRTSACWWVWVEGQVTPEIHARIVATIQEWAASPAPSCMLFVARDTNTPTPQERRELAETILSARRRDHLRGFALVTDSPIVRGALTAVGWIVGPSMPYAAFATPADALAWLRKQHAAVDTTAVRDEIRRAVPSAHVLRW